MKTKELIDQIRNVRIKKELSQEYLADCLKIDTSSYSRIERGDSKLTLDRFFKICEVLGIKIDIVIQDEKSENYVNEPGVEYLSKNKVLENEIKFYQKLISAYEKQIELLERYSNDQSEFKKIG